MNSKLLSYSTYTLILSMTAVTGESHDWSPSRPDGHAPIMVMGDHTHVSGEWMLSFRHMTMEMTGKRDKNDRIHSRAVLRQFRVAPTSMSMQMSMLGVMWSPSDDYTLMFMLPYLRNEMDHVTRTGAEFDTESEGFGDFRASAMVNIAKWTQQKLHLNLGLGFPTGSINRKGDTPTGNVRLPYPMQLGAGTFDFMPGLTYLGQRDIWSWGGQVSGTIRLGENKYDYALGDRVVATTWGACKWRDWLSTSLRISIENWSDIDGADPRLDPTLAPTADPERRAGTRLNLALGANFYSRQGMLQGHRLAIEWELPVYQYLDGPQLETDWALTFGWQRAW